MFTFAQPAYRCYSPYEELVMQQKLQRRRQMEAYLRRQREVDEMERRRREYEVAVRAEYEQRREAELERRRQAELQRRRQAQQARGRHSIYDGEMESLIDALYGGSSPRQVRSWDQQQAAHQSNVGPRKTPTSTPVRDSTPTPVPVSAPPAEPEPTPEPKLELEKEPQVDTTPSYTAVQSILSSFTTVQSDFTFPPQLDYIAGTSKLAYTPNNAPLHAYEHALTGLLTQLDAVESYGEDGVRRARKEAVKMIERELERLDGIKAEAWKRTSEPEPLAPSTETKVDPISVSLPAGDEDAQDEEMEDCFQTTVSETTSTSDLCAVFKEPLAPADSQQTEPATSSETVHSTSLEPCTDTDLASPPTADTQPVHPDDAVLGTPLPYTPTPEPLARSLTSLSPSEVSDSDSDSDLELEEYVDVETMSTSEDEGTDLEKVENDGDLVLMGDWDLDF